MLMVQEVVMVIRILLEMSTLKYFFPIFNFKLGLWNHFSFSLSNCFNVHKQDPPKLGPFLSSNVLTISPYFPFHNYVPEVWNHLWMPLYHSPRYSPTLFSSSRTLFIEVFPWIFSSPPSPFKDFPDNLLPKKDELGFPPFYSLSILWWPQLQPLAHWF